MCDNCDNIVNTELFWYTKLVMEFFDSMISSRDRKIKEKTDIKVRAYKYDLKCDFKLQMLF